MIDEIEAFKRSLGFYLSAAARGNVQCMNVELKFNPVCETYAAFPIADWSCTVSGGTSEDDLDL